MHIVSTREFEGHDVLALDSGLSPRSFAKSKLPRLMGQYGYILSPSGQIEQWIPEGTFCTDTGSGEIIFVYGPAFQGESLFSAISGSDREHAWKLSHQCISAISRAAASLKLGPETLTLIAGSGPEAILAADDGRVLVLPGEVYTRCLDGQGNQAVRENRLLWIHPDYSTLNPAWAFSFMAGTLAYRILAGYPPFRPEGIQDPAELTLNMRNGIFEPLELALWSIRPPAAYCINALISTGIATSTDTLLAFGPVLESLLDPAKKEIPETVEFEKTKKLAAGKRESLVHRKKWVRQNRGIFLAIAVALVFVGLLAGSYIHDMSSRPSTKGMKPQDVVTGYYKGIASLDQEIPSAYVEKGVHADYSDFLTNLYVTSKVRQAYERDAGIISPSQLFVLRKPGNKSIFGITALSVTKVQETDTRAEFSASFYLWMPTGSGQTGTDTDGTNPGILLSIYKYLDTVIVEKKNHLWKISAIDNKERTIVENDGAHLLAGLADGSADTLLWAPSDAEIAKAKADLADQGFK